MNNSAGLRCPVFLVFCLCLITAPLSAECFAEAYKTHDCCGEGCPVCLAVREMGNLVRQLKSPALYSGFPINAPSAGAPALRLVVLYRIPISSVRLKVKMNE